MCSCMCMDVYRYVCVHVCVHLFVCMWMSVKSKSKGGRWDRGHGSGQGGTQVIGNPI